MISMKMRILAKAWTLTLGILFCVLRACAERTCLVSMRNAVRPQDETNFSEKGSLQLLECTKEPVTCSDEVCHRNYSETCLCRLRCSGNNSSCFGTDSGEALIEHDQASPLNVPRVSCVAADLHRAGILQTYAAVSSCSDDWPQDGARRYCEADHVTSDSTSSENVELVTS